MRTLDSAAVEGMSPERAAQGVGERGEGIFLGQSPPLGLGLGSIGIYPVLQRHSVEVGCPRRR